MPLWGVSNPASTLHDLLERVAGYGPDTLRTAWSEVLDSEFESADFARRHCEVVMLLRDTLRVLTVLPEASQKRYGRYTNAWWLAVIAPTMFWQTAGHRADVIIDQSNLDQLAALGELIGARFASTALSPAATGDVPGLRAACVDWLAYLNEVTSLRAESRAVLRAQVEHLIWLIDNISMFGPSRVVEDAQAVVTSVATTMAEVKDQEQRSGWQQKTRKLLVTVAGFTLAAPLVLLPALTNAVDIAEQVNRGINVVAEIADGPGGGATSGGGPTEPGKP